MITSLAVGEAANVEEQVRIEQLRLLFEHGPVAFSINGAVALLLILLVGPHVPRHDLEAWIAVFGTAWVMRGALYLWRWRAPDALSRQTWRALFAAGTFLAGCSWGLTALWLFPPSITDRFFVAVTIIALASGASASLSCVRGIYPLYVFPAFLPVAIRFAFDGGMMPVVVIGLAALYTFGMSAAASMNYRLLSASLRLRFTNLELARQLERVANHDPLTALPNRLMFLDRLSEALLRSKRSSEPLAVVYLDCDNFKEINDAYGHAAGDAFLIAIARSLEHAVRETDTVARLGGDEFVVLMEGCGDRLATQTAVQRIRERAQSLTVGGVALAARFSIGVARHPDDAADVDSLIRRADEAMYRAKREGGNGIRFAGRMMEPT